MKKMKYSITVILLLVLFNINVKGQDEPDAPNSTYFLKDFPYEIDTICGFNLILNKPFPEDFKNLMENKFHFGEKIKDWDGITGTIVINKDGSAYIKELENWSKYNFNLEEIAKYISSISGWKVMHYHGNAVVSKILFSIRNIDDTLAITAQYPNDCRSCSSPVRSFNKVKIENKHYSYSSDNSDLVFTHYTYENSNIADDMMRAITVDSSNVIWCGTDNGLVKIKDGALEIIDDKNSMMKRSPYGDLNILSLTVDIFNNKWISTGDGVYRISDSTWSFFDSTNSPLKGVINIYADKFGSVWFIEYDDLIRFDGKKWTVINKESSNIPEERILSVFVDSKKQVWIGTVSQTVVLNWDLSPYDYDTEMKYGRLLKGYEDKKGTYWVSMYMEGNKNSGLLKYTSLNIGETFNIENSGLPSSYIADFIIDEKRDIIWLTTGDGIVKYDGKKWNFYTYENSIVPNSIISALTLDNSGNVWCTTFYGLIKIEHK